MWTVVSILFLLDAFSAVVGIGNARSIADKTSVVVGAVIALVTDSNKNGGSHIGIANDTLSLTLFTQTTDGDAPLLAAHY